MSTPFERLDRTILTAVGGQRAANALQKPALQIITPDIASLALGDDTISRPGSPGRSLVVCSRVKVVEDSDKETTCLGLQPDTRSIENSDGGGMVKNTELYGSHCCPTKPKQIDRSPSCPPLTSSGSPNYNTPSTYPPSPTHSSGSSINTDGSVPEAVTNCPSITFIRRHYQTLDELHAFFKSRRKAKRSKRISWAKKSLALRELPCTSRYAVPELIFGRPPTYESLSPLAAAVRDEERIVYSDEEVFADS